MLATILSALCSLSGTLFATVLIYFFVLAHQKDTTSISGWRCMYCVAIYSLFAVAVGHFQWSALTTFALLPIPAYISYLAVRARVGIPATHSGENIASGYKGKRFQLVSLPGSHYGEKVRWALDLLQAPYEEISVGGFLTSLLRGRSLPWLVDKQTCSHIGNSGECILYIGAVYAPEIADPKLREHALRFVRRDATTVEWEAKLLKIGLAIQGYGYLQAIKYDPDGVISKFIWGVHSPRVTWLERTVLDRFYPWFKQMLLKGGGFLSLEDEELQKRRKAELDKTLDEVDAALTKTGAYILGDHLSYIDVAFCAQAAPLCAFSIMFANPTLWAGGHYSDMSTAKERGIEKVYPPNYASEEAATLKRPCGKLIMRMYKQRASAKTQWPE